MSLVGSIAGFYCLFGAGQIAITVFRGFNYSKHSQASLPSFQMVYVQCVKQYQVSWHQLCKGPVAIEQSNEKMNPSENITTTLHLTAASFEAQVLESKQPVLVVFGAPWSRPCQILDPVLQELARDWEGKAKVVSVNADDSLDLSLCYDIQSIPTLLYFVEGKLRLRIVGTATKDAILAKLKASGFADSIDTLVKEASGAGAANSKGGLI